MWMIGKTVVLLFFELITEYLFGTLLAKLILKKEVNPAMSLLLGFLSYQALFQPAALIVAFTTGVLHHLTTVWVLILAFTILVSVIVCREIVKRQIRGMAVFWKEHKRWFILTVIIVLAFCYYVSINGESNEDARYYIALMTTSVDTDTMFKHNVYNGYRIESLYLRRVLATFEMHSAVLSQWFEIHPLLIARIFRACQNVILTSAAVYLCGQCLFWEKEEHTVDKSLAGVIVFWFVQPVFVNTIYTPSTFLLYRAYEAKAFTANLVVLFGLYLCASILKQWDFRMLFILILFIWGSMSLSTSAMMIAGAEGVILLLPVWFIRWIMKKKQEKQYAG